MDFLKTHQLSLMLYLSGICGVLIVMALMSKTLSKRRRRILALFEAAGMILLLSDRYAYIYRGNTSELGFWMVRICNFLVYFLTLYITHSITLYLRDLLENEGGLKTRPIRLLICELFFTAGTILIIISQFTGLYYTFDDQNRYVRSPGSLLCYILPILIMLIQMSLVLQYRKELGNTIALSLLFNSVIPIIAAAFQAFFYGLSLINITVVGMAIILYLFVLIDLNNKVERAKYQEIEFYKKEHEHEHELFEQTAEALASAIDAKDKYTHGHSSRVAAYSQQIARQAGKSEEECEKVYFAALLHDVGKIGIPDNIINKDGKLTDEEFAQIKMHPVYGNQILSRIQSSPYLSIGAHYHHERYDGRGYPDGLKGDDIPEIARIIGVADAYDAMTSKRSYRDPIPQDKVREELVKGMGTQFDPRFAKIMQHLIDIDTEYNMKEQGAGADISIKTSINCDRLYHECSTGILLSENITRINFFWKPIDKEKAGGGPALVLFDSLDGRYQDTEEKRRDLMYLEYGVLHMDGRFNCEAARKIKADIVEDSEADLQGSRSGTPAKMTQFDIEAVRCEDHLRIRIMDEAQTTQFIVALPDSSRFCYVAVTGENCVLRGVMVEQEEEKVTPDMIPRIAEKVSFIEGCPQGDIPNVQVDRWCSAHSEAIPVKGDMKLTFNAMSLPTARLIWHCPYISVFTSKDGIIGGEGYREYVLVRMDGENWESEENFENLIMINQTADFKGWNEWKKRFKEGLDCEVSIKLKDNQITVTTENLGVEVRSVTTIYDRTDDLFVALTGDQSAITNIKIQNMDEMT